jgi:diadenosine tetraphosphate (Ap4A) HIT family hydrolase
MTVARAVGRAIERAFRPAKVGLLIGGLEVPHLHLHVIPLWQMSDLNPANQDMKPDPADLDGAAEALRAALRALGYAHVAP